MTDKNGNQVAVGCEQQSSESINDAGIIECIKIEGNVATFRKKRFTSLPMETTFVLAQQSLTNSKWIVLNHLGEKIK